MNPQDIVFSIISKTIILILYWIFKLDFQQFGPFGGKIAAYVAPQNYLKNYIFFIFKDYINLF